MAKTILNFHFDYLTTPLMWVTGKGRIITDWTVLAMHVTFAYIDPLNCLNTSRPFTSGIIWVAAL